MKPEDILDGLGQINEQMVLDAENLKKSPRRSLKIGSMAACILCGVALLGLCAAKLWNQPDQQSQKPPEPTLPPITSALPQDSAEESETEPQTVDPEQSGTIVNDFQVVVREDAVYFVDPYIGLMSMDPETKITQTILPNGACSLVETDGNLYCLSQASRRVDLVENGEITTLVTLEDVGPGYPILLGVSDGYVCWQQNWTIYAASIEDGVAKEILPYNAENGGYLSWGVYQGAVYTTNALNDQFYRTALDSGETTELSSEMLLTEDGMTAKGAGYSTERTEKTAENGIYVLGQIEDGEATRDACFFYEPENGSIMEIPVEVSELASIDVWDGILYLKNQVDHEGILERNVFLSYDMETGETTTLLDETQTAEMGGIGEWWIAPGGIYYTRRLASSLYYYDFSTGSNTPVYQSDGIYGSLVMEPDYYWQQGDVYDAGAWYEHFNEVKDYYDLTVTDTGIYYVDPADGVYRYLPEEERVEQLVSGIACRILDCDEGLYVTCSDSGEVYEIKDGTAQLLLTLEKEQKIAVKPIAVKNGKLYWNYFVTDLATGETQTKPIFQLKKSQPQILHDGKIYCLGGNGEIGYVDPTGGTETYRPLTDALGTNTDDWAVKFFEDYIIALQKTADGTGFDVYKIAYEDGSATRLGAITGENVNILNLEGDTLYFAPKYDGMPYEILAMNITTGETETVTEESVMMNGMEAAVWQGKCFCVWREDIMGEFDVYDLETGENTVYMFPNDAVGQ